MSLPSPDNYQELRMMAKHIMRSERKGHTLSATDLFHEAYWRLSPLLSPTCKDLGEFRSLFALTMRRVLIEYARKRARRNRRYSRLAISSDELVQFLDLSNPQEDSAERLLDLDLALSRFAEKFPMHARVVELKYFGGLTVQQCAEQLEISPATVNRYWNFARAWIGREMEKIDPPC